MSFPLVSGSWFHLALLIRGFSFKVGVGFFDFDGLRSSGGTPWTDAMTKASSNLTKYLFGCFCNGLFVVLILCRSYVLCRTL